MAPQRLRAIATAVRVHDQLTGVLLTRSEFMRRAERKLSRSEAATLLLFDIDRLKPVNDMLGYEAVDAMLVALARRVKLAAMGNLVGRYGGDEFVVLVDGEPRARELLEGIRADFAEQFCAERTRTRTKLPDLCDVPLLTFSAGAATRASSLETLPQLVRRCDTGLSEAKSSGRDCVR